MLSLLKLTPCRLPNDFHASLSSLGLTLLFPSIFEGHGQECSSLFTALMSQIWEGFQKVFLKLLEKTILLGRDLLS